MNIRETAYDLYWKHVDPLDVEDEELKEELIKIIKNEEWANEIRDDREELNKILFNY